MMATNPHNTTHPAIAAHVAGKSTPFDSGKDWEAYLVTLAHGSYIVTEWATGEVAVQEV